MYPPNSTLLQSKYIKWCYDFIELTDKGENGNQSFLNVNFKNNNNQYLFLINMHSEVE